MMWGRGSPSPKSHQPAVEAAALPRSLLSAVRFASITRLSRMRPDADSR